MSLFRTPTPLYYGQGGSPVQSGPDWTDWICQLFRTPTPLYLEAPTTMAQVKPENADR